MVRSRRVTYYRTPVALVWKRAGLGFSVLLLLVLALRLVGTGRDTPAIAGVEPVRKVTRGAQAAPSASNGSRPARTTASTTASRQVVGAINPSLPGLTTFRGNLTRSYYGEGPVPRGRPRVLWRYPRTGGMCAPSADETGTHTWCGIGWTGQPNVIPRPSGRVELRFGAYDRAYHFLDSARGRRVRESLLTGDLAKGSATSDPDGFPLYWRRLARQQAAGRGARPRAPA